jgi:hypothetical protein
MELIKPLAPSLSEAKLAKGQRRPSAWLYAAGRASDRLSTNGIF